MRVVGIALAVAIGATVPGVFVGWEVQPELGVAAQSLSGGSAMTSLSWASSRSASDVALEVRILSEGRLDCVVTFAAAGRTTAGGAEFVKVVRTGDSLAWSSLHADGYVQAHVEGVVDTRGVDVVREGDRWAVRSEHRRSDVVGGLSVFFAARHVTPWEEREWTGSDAVRLGVECDGPFRIGSVLGARGASILNERSLRHGQTVHVGGVGTMVRGEGVQADLASPQARMLLGQANNEGTLGLTMPQGRQTVSLAKASSFYDVAQGPGAYGVALDCFCRGSLWAVLADLRPAASLDAAWAATG